MKEEDQLELLLKKFKISPTTEIWAEPQNSSIKGLPDQGFKIHISATVLNCTKILEKIAPLLLKDQVYFKVIRNIALLEQLNSGIISYFQIGKFMTIYPPTPDIAFELATRLDELTCEFDSIIIPSDLQFGDNSNIFIRYGLFSSSKEKLKDRDNIEHDDKRDGNPIPNWIQYNPFKDIRTSIKDILKEKKIVITKVLRQRGKGGVYEALRMPNNPREIASKIILKEGRYLGEISDQGICGFVLIENESRALRMLQGESFAPKVIDNFSTTKNKFLVMEKLDGISLSRFINKSSSISLDICESVTTKIAKILQKCHNRGIYICDLSPDNIIIGNCIYIVDWELSVFEDSLVPPRLNFGKRGFFIPSYEQNVSTETLIERDVFAFSRIMYSLLNPIWYRSILTSKNRNAFDFISIPKIKNQKHEETFIKYFGNINTHYILN